jgi:hypothetical protein
LIKKINDFIINNNKENGLKAKNLEKDFKSFDLY